MNTPPPSPSHDADEALRQRLRKRRNIPPEHGIRVPAEAMQALVAGLFVRAGTSREDAELLGRILSANDLRCVFSHGTAMIADYLKQIRDGAVNPRPQIKTVHEAPGALVLDGDGGLGYFPCWRGTERIIAKAKTCGAAVLTTRNHYHFGAAGNYTRLAIAHQCIGLAVSNHRTTRHPDQPLSSTLTSSPISFGIPTAEQPPLVMDMASHVVGFNRDSFAEQPQPFFKSMALSHAVQVLGGAVAGIYLHSCLQGPWTSNQGSFIAVFDTEKLMPPGQVQRQVDQYASEARRMQPIPGTESSELAGGNEWAWERENRQVGIPLSDAHRERLEAVAAEWGVDDPFARWKDARF